MPGLEFVQSRLLGGAWLLDGLWHRLGIDTLLRRLAAGTRRAPLVERVLFALVANRRWRCRRSWPHLVVGPRRAPSRVGAGVDDACYRAMGWLIQIEDQLARGVFDQVAHLLNPVTGPPGSLHRWRWPRVQPLRPRSLLAVLWALALSSRMVSIIAAWRSTSG